MSKFLDRNLRVDTYEEVELGTTGQVHFSYNGSALLFDSTAAFATQLGSTGAATLRFGDAGQGVSSFSTDITLGGVAASNSALSTQLAVKTYVDSKIAGLDWQESVLAIVDPTAVPPTEVTGDRYILADDVGTIHADWDSADRGDVVEFDGTDWVVTYDASAEEGGAVFNEDDNIMYTHSAGTDDWVTFAAGMDHGSLVGLADDDHTQYLYLSGRAGGQSIIGGTESGNDLSFATTSNATKGNYIFSENATAGAAYFNSSGHLLVEAQLAQARGGTGLDTSGVTNGQLLIGNTVGNVFALATLTGTTDQITVTNAASSITLSLPGVVYVDDGAFAGTFGHNSDAYTKYSDDRIETWIADFKIASWESDGFLAIYGGTPGSTSGSFAMYDVLQTHWVGFKAPDSVTSNGYYILPADDGDLGDYLVTDGAYGLSWEAPASSVPDGTITSSILRWSGTAWVEEVDFLVDASANLDLSGTITAGSGNTQITNSAGALQQTYNFTENNVLTDNDGVYAALEKIDLKWGDLASVTVSQGASLVGIYDVDNYYAATTVEGALAEIGNLTNGVKIKSGRKTDIASGVSSATVTFSTAFANDSYTVVCVLVNDVDAAPSQHALTVSDYQAASFTVDFSGNTDSANYDLHWIAIHD